MRQATALQRSAMSIENWALRFVFQKGDPRWSQKHTSNHTQPHNALKTQDTNLGMSVPNDGSPDFQYM